MWGREVSGPAALLRDLAEPTATLHSDEIYVVADGCDDTNTKIRDGRLDVKILRRVIDRCEQWQPWIKVEFPVPVPLLTDSLLPRLGAADLSSRGDSWQMSELLEQLRHHTRTGVADVSKQRTKYVVGGCLAEIATVIIDGSELRTLAIESTDLDALGALRSRLQLEPLENVSYPRAIRLTMYQAGAVPEAENGYGD